LAIEVRVVEKETQDVSGQAFIYRQGVRVKKKSAPPVGVLVVR
jgi:hypothetical protein